MTQRAHPDIKPARVGGNAKMTDNIYNALFNLIQQEQDFYTKKKHSAAWYRDKIAETLQPEKNPTLRSYEEYTRKIREYLRSLIQTPPDVPWTIGACAKYSSYFPPETVPMLLKYQALFSDLDNKYCLHIREAIWIVRLHPIIEQIYPPEVEKYTCYAAEYYAQAEKISNSKNEDVFDTSVYDSLLYSGDFDSLFEKATDDIIDRINNGGKNK